MLHIQYNQNVDVVVAEHLEIVLINANKNPESPIKTECRMIANVISLALLTVCLTMLVNAHNANPHTMQYANLKNQQHAHATLDQLCITTICTKRSTSQEPSSNNI